jgi:hypothetical protein
MRLLRAINAVWAVSWDWSLIGILTRAWDRIVDRSIAPRKPS